MIKAHRAWERQLEGGHGVETGQGALAVQSAHLSLWGLRHPSLRRADSAGLVAQSWPWPWEVDTQSPVGLRAAPFHSFPVSSSQSQGVLLNAFPPPFLYPPFLPLNMPCSLEPLGLLICCFLCLEYFLALKLLYYFASSGLCLPVGF